MSTFAIPQDGGPETLLPGLPQVAPVRPIPPAAPLRPADRRSVRPRPFLPSSPSIYPWLAERFAPGEASLWIGDGAPIDRLLRILVAGSARALGRVSFVMGSDRLDPYGIAEAGRSLGVEPGEVLRRVRIARAFTGHQLVALIDGWAGEVRRSRPTLLVAHKLPGAFADGDVPPEERAALLGHIARTLRRVAEMSRVPMLVTLGGEPAIFPGLLEEGPRLADVVRCRERDGPLDLASYRTNARLALVHRPSGQRGLEEFAGAPPEEVMPGWDAPPPRTARRSRSA